MPLRGLLNQSKTTFITYIFSCVMFGTSPSSYWYIRSTTAHPAARSSCIHAVYYAIELNAIIISSLHTYGHHNDSSLAVWNEFLLFFFYFVVRLRLPRKLWASSLLLATVTFLICCYQHFLLYHLKSNLKWAKFA